jgi:dTDP-4-dehydrorhamnose 3,5-epimerase
VPRLPAGVALRALPHHGDARGALIEAYRDDWEPAPSRQWDLQQSNAGVLRGVHVHPRRDDYIVVVSGHLTVGMRDLRRGSPTFGNAGVVDLVEDRAEALVIPHGVAHGLYFHHDTVLLLGLSVLYDPADELGCRWDDPALQITWPARAPILSPRDTSAPPMADLVRALEPHQPFAP